MIVLNVFLSIKPEEEANFMEFVKGLVKNSRAESGNLMYNLYKQSDDLCKYIIVEHWENDEAIERHNKTEHFQKFASEIGNYVAEPFDIQKYNA